MDYILHGDLGAVRAVEDGWANPARMGVKSETYEDEATDTYHVFIVSFEPVSCYPYTRSANRFIPDLMKVALGLEHRIDKAPQATTIPDISISTTPTPRVSTSLINPPPTTMHTRSKADTAPVAAPRFPIRVSTPVVGVTPGSAIDKIQVPHKKASLPHILCTLIAWIYHAQHPDEVFILIFFKNIRDLAPRRFFHSGKFVFNISLPAVIYTNKKKKNNLCHASPTCS